MIFIIILLGLYVWRIEPRWVRWNKIDMPIQHLPEGLINKKLVQISDIHIGETVNEDYIINQFKQVNKLKPDIVVYTGDFISPINIDQAPFEQLERTLQHAAKGQLATIAILGNHDYGILGRNAARADSVVQILKNHGIRVLRNENVKIKGLNIIGIDDCWGTNFYPLKAMRQFKDSLANIVLVHNPDVCDIDIWKGYNSWILSGHTHGGQVRFPFQKASRLPVENKNYDEGLKKLSNDRTLYINKGLGHSIRVRLNVRPEIAIFTLKKKG
ncbi:metallophosphoesterase [Sphingobacterium bovistauri]|uniref:Metallophosphoesterase n=1 Tax=Sphingobacterium bovistauri TaxID=2781959 RepID=A0ABS7Z868_9SPHI|nr:metallophosphoesterase [Sphingobacterium bovistauri]MCA5006388.1 metallophosphoesterase [Sphingobacterium bovistauri]